MSLPTLPDLCLFGIFDHLPPRDLLSLHLVCNRWDNLQRTACGRRKRLTICIGQDPIGMLTTSMFAEELPHPDDRLQFPWLNQDVTDFLLFHFSRLTVLHIVIHRIPTTALLKIVDMLDSLSPTLKSLQLNLQFMGNEPAAGVTNRFTALFQSINALPALEHLTLEIRHLLNFEHINLPILRRLHQFRFSSLDRISSLMASLRNYAVPNQNLSQICLITPIHDLNSIDDLLKLDQNLGQKFTHLLPGLSWHDQSRLAQFCNHFRSLTYLHLSIGTLSLRQLTTAMRNLTSLTNFSIMIDFIQHHQPLSLEDGTPPADFHPLSSVRNLKVTTTLSSHRQLESVHLGHIFPGLETLRIEYTYNECTACRFDNFELLDEEARMQCVQWLVRPWQEQCTRLQRLVTAAQFLQHPPVIWVNRD